ncbi:DUF2306 domain-containing protein [Echinicola shivajiensis]|uniref:DUF2306 domain-containing protein n=1 Tax=Echinicola shivajiensis TaxID=1035916 RepID=UPI001FE50A74|nr:DUF2306 domain-containing protein [Echinicola shivajiensis]
MGNSFLSIVKKLRWFVFALFSLLIGVYPLVYIFMNDRDIGFLGTKSLVLLNSFAWNLGFYVHIVFAGIALLIGWVQFSTKIRNQHIKIHRTIGRFYVICGLLGALAGFYLGFYATGTWLTKMGFIILGLCWFSSTFAAYFYILRKEIIRHQKMMIYSYALCWAAVTLRIYLPFLNMIFPEFITAYTIVAWLCWVPNMALAWWINHRIIQKVSDPIL